MAGNKKTVFKSDTLMSVCGTCVATLPYAVPANQADESRAHVVYCSRCGVVMKNRFGFTGGQFQDEFDFWFYAVGPHLSEIHTTVPALACPHGCGRAYYTYPDRCLGCERLIG
jgi:hypothetical protein